MSPRIRRDEITPAVFASAASTEEHAEAILGVDAEVMSCEEFTIALEVARDRGVVEHVDGGYVAVE